MEVRMANDARKIAEAAMPGWRAVETPLRDSQAMQPEADQIGRGLDALKTVYSKSSETAGSKPRRRPAGAKPEGSEVSQTRHTTMVVMERVNQVDAEAVRKVVLVDEESGEVEGFPG
jgi:hypothetical protein